MIDFESLTVLESNLKRIFGLPIARSTYREIQNVIRDVSKREESVFSELFQGLYSGDCNLNIIEENAREKMLSLIEDFSVLIRLAKDVFERGDFLNLLTTESISPGNQIALLHNIRRVDGDEMHFVTDVEGTIQMIEHLIQRLSELNLKEKDPEGYQKHRIQMREVEKKVTALIGT